MSRRETYIFSGGGTGGHLFPGIAVAEELVARDEQSRILFVGSQRVIEADVLELYGIEHRALTVEPSTTLTRNPVRFAWQNLNAYREARQLLLDECPRAVFGLGGFASVPVVLAASRLHIPTILLEQNTVPGRATRWLSSRVSAICLSFEESRAGLGKTGPSTRVITTGNPVRREISRLTGESENILETRPRTLLVLGGSQGAKAVNDAVLLAAECLQDQLSSWKIIHQTGASQHEQVRDRYLDLKLHAETAPFLSNLPTLYAETALVISRAGATSLAELACASLPTILIPYPNSIGDHQLRNARHYQLAGAAMIVEQRQQTETTAEILTARLSSLLTDSNRRQRMSQSMRELAIPHAAESVVELLMELTGSSKQRSSRIAS